MASAFAASAAASDGTTVSAAAADAATGVCSCGGCGSHGGAGLRRDLAELRSGQLGPGLLTRHVEVLHAGGGGGRGRGRAHDHRVRRRTGGSAVGERTDHAARGVGHGRTHVERPARGGRHGGRGGGRSPHGAEVDGSGIAAARLVGTALLCGGDLFRLYGRCLLRDRGRVAAGRARLPRDGRRVCRCHAGNDGHGALHLRQLLLRGSVLRLEPGLLGVVCLEALFLRLRGPDLVELRLLRRDRGLGRLGRRGHFDERRRGRRGVLRRRLLRVRRAGRGGRGLLGSVHGRGGSVVLYLVGGVVHLVLAAVVLRRRVVMGGRRYGGVLVGGGRPLRVTRLGGCRVLIAPRALRAGHQQQVVLFRAVLGGFEEGVRAGSGDARLLHHACVLRQPLARDLAGVSHARTPRPSVAPSPFARGVRQRHT
ncbi:UNVERIFIED_CONTAM: hypothetical protein RKD43_001128 [Streptomyces graminofaciens]